MKAFIKGALSEDDGLPSCSRLLSIFFAAFGIVWASAVVAAHIYHKVEPVIPDLTGVGYLVGLPYGLNLAHSAATQIYGNKDNSNGGKS